MTQLLRRIAELKGDEPALIDERGSTSWSDFDARANRFIHALRARGLEPGATVALMSGNRREAFEITVAAAHAAWVIVPVNWHWVEDELVYVVEDAAADALIVEDEFFEVGRAAADRLGATCPVRIVIGDVGAGTDGAEPLSDAAPFEGYEDVLTSGSPTEPTDQARGGPMFYTSGTTGFPKGVRSALTASGGDIGMLELICAGFADMLGLPNDGVTLLEGPMYHSAQWVFAVFPLLGRASTVVMRHRFDPAETLELIDRHGVTNLHLVPTQFLRMLKLPDAVRAGFDGASLEVVYHGAAPCPTAVKRSMLDWWGAKVTEYYGGTEGGFLTMISGSEWLERPGSIGKALAAIELLVLDEEGHECPVSTPGQIYFKSLMGSDFEYHNAPEKTAAAHSRDGYGTLGDIGYVDEDGFVFLSDRKIDMIISGGVNIYPAEIEGVLVTHPAVADAAVFGVPDDEFGEQVKAVVELMDGVEASDDLGRELIDHVRLHLAGYKAPRSVEFSAQLPRTPTGKLLKRQIREPYWEGSGRTI
jgi:long-chain acyl-CoA synthetase